MDYRFRFFALSAVKRLSSLSGTAALAFALAGSASVAPAAITLNSPADYSTVNAKSSGARSVNSALANGAFTATTTYFKKFATKSKAAGDERDTMSKDYNTSGLVTLAWSGAASGRECTVTIRRAKDNSVVRTLKSKTGSVQFVSPEIGRNYTWTVSDGSSTSAVGHFFVAADAPRIINVSAIDWGISNARDLGGWTTSDGKVVKQGLVYRSPQFDWYMPGYVDPDDDEHPGPRIGAPFYYDTLGIGFDLDLRKVGDVRASEYVEYQPASGQVDIRVSPLGPNIPRFFTDYDDESSPFGNYSGIFSTPAMKAMHKGFSKVIENLKSGMPLVFHCAQGKDRTGSLAYVLNGLLGVPRDSLRLDWAWTYVADSSVKTTELLIDQIEQGLNKSPYNTVSGIPARLEKYVKACYKAGGSTEAQAASDIATLRAKMLETPETPAENPGGGSSDSFAYRKFYWRRHATGGSWESSTGYWYKQPTGTAKWNPTSPLTQQDAAYLLPLADANFCYADPANGGKIELGYIESDATYAKTGSVGIDTTKPRFSNDGHGVTDRAVWVHKAGKAYANNVDFYFDGTGKWWVEIRGGTTFAFRDFQVMESANCGVRFPEGDCDGATLEIEPNDDSHWTSKFAWFEGGAAGTRQALTVRNALAQAYASGRTSGVAGALDFRFELGANNTASSAAMLAVTGTLKVNAGSTLTVDAGQKPAGTYKLVACGTLTCDAALYTGANVSNCKSGTYGVVEKKGAALNLVIKSGTAPATDKLATAPTAKSGLKYTGGAQTGVPAGTGYTISGNTATDAGNYQATVTLDAGYQWSDGLASASRTVSWSIAKGANAWTENPSVTPSSWTVGSAPASIAFSNGANKFGAAVSCDTSAAVLKALAGGESKVVTFTAAASANWDAITHQVTVSVAKQGGEFEEAHTVFAWLKTDGKGYFDTGSAPDQGATRVVMDVEFLSDSNETALFGASSHITLGKGWYDGFDVYVADDGHLVVFENWNNATDTGTEDNEFAIALGAGRHTFDASQNVLKVDGTAYTATLSGGKPVAGTAGSNLFLFRNNEGYGQDVLKLYSAKIYESGVLKHDYVPATNATGVACLYDKVAKACLLPTAATAFEVGNDETPTVRTAILPTAKSSLVYTGDEQTGVEDGIGCTVTAGGSATMVGPHTATLALADGYEWPDAPKTGTRTVSWTIAKGVNQWTVKPSVTPSDWAEGSVPATIRFSNGANKFGAAVSCDTTEATLKSLAGGASKVVTFKAEASANWDEITYAVTVSVVKQGEAPGEAHTTFDWLKTDGTGFFDTGFAPDQGATRVAMEVEFLSDANETALFGASSHITKGKGWDDGFDLYVTDAGRRAVFENWNNATETGTEDNEFAIALGAGRHTFEASQNELIIDGTDYTATLSGGKPVAGLAGSNLFLFRNNEGGGQDVLKLYSAKIYEGNSLVHDYVPATNAAGVACLYDEVTKQCLLPTGATAFEVGNGGGAPTSRTATLPVARTGLVYNGIEQTGVEDGIGCTVTEGGAATTAGEHVAIVELAEGYQWPDTPKLGERLVSWLIAKGVNQWTVKPSVTPSSWTADAPPATITIANGATEFGARITCDTTADALKGLAAGTSKTVTFTADADGDNYDALTFTVTVTALKGEEEEPDYVAWYWGRKTTGATWTSATYWYKNAEATTKWNAYPDGFDACAYLVQTADAADGVGPALQDGTFEVGKVVTRGASAVGYGTLVFRNASAAERTLWTVESGSFSMNGMTLRMSDDSTAGMGIDVRGGATLRFDNGFTAPDDIGVRLSAEASGATLRFTDGVNALGFVAGGKAGVAETLEIANARVVLAQASGLAGPVQVEIALGEFNTSQPSLSCAGAFTFALGSTLSVDAAQLPAGTYPLVEAASLAGADDLAAAAAVANVKTATTAKVVKTGATLSLVIENESGDEPVSDPHTEFQWLRTDATGWFDTRYTPNLARTEVRMKVRFVDSAASSALFGASGRLAGSKDWGATYGLDCWGQALDYSNFGGGKGVSFESDVPFSGDVEGQHVFVAKGTTLTVDGASFVGGGEAPDLAASSTLRLFTSTGGDDIKPKKVYSVQILEGDELVHDYVPATNATGIACLYDKVTKTCLLPTDATAFEVGNDETDPEPPVVDADVTVTVDATGAKGRVLPNPESSLTFWGGPNSAHRYPEFCRWAQSFCATGGSKSRDLFLNPENRTVRDDYAFSKLVNICRAAIDSGLKPYVKLGNVPLKLSSAPFLSKSYEVNVRPPDDYEEYYRYMKGAAQALVDEFGVAEVRTWRFSVLTEANNLSWFAAAPGGNRANTNAVTKTEFFKLYDWTAKAFTEVVGEDVIIGTHLLAVNDSNNKTFTYKEFIAHCKSGANAATGGTGAPLKLLAFSYYFNHPDDDNLAAGVPEDWGLFRGELDAAGFTDAIITLDEGRVYQGKNLGDKKTSLPTRAVGMSWQAAFDLRLAKTLWENGGDTFATWGALSGEETLYEGFDTVVSQTGRELARFEGLRILAAPSVVSGLTAKESVDAVAAVDDEGRVVRFAASRFRDKLEFSDAATAAFKVTLPTTMRGRSAYVSLVTIDDTNNWFADWVRGIGTNGFTADDIYCNRYDQSPLLGLWADESKARFQREFAPLYEAKAKLVTPVTRAITVPEDGVLTVPFTFVGNSVAFASVTLDEGEDPDPEDEDPADPIVVNSQASWTAWMQGVDTETKLAAVKAAVSGRPAVKIAIANFEAGHDDFQVNQMNAMAAYYGLAVQIVAIEPTNPEAGRTLDVVYRDAVAQGDVVIDFKSYWTADECDRAASVIANCPEKLFILPYGEAGSPVPPTSQSLQGRARHADGGGLANMLLTIPLVKGNTTSLTSIARRTEGDIATAAFVSASGWATGTGDTCQSASMAAIAAAWITAARGDSPSAAEIVRLLETGRRMPRASDQEYLGFTAADRETLQAKISEYATTDELGRKKLLNDAPLNLGRVLRILPEQHVHSWGAWTTETSATCEGYGRQVRMCAVAGCPDRCQFHTLLPLGHDWGAWEDDPSDPSRQVRHCVRTGCDATDMRVFHVVGDDGWGWQKTVTEGGAEYVVLVFTNVVDQWSFVLPDGVAAIDYVVVAGGGGGGAGNNYSTKRGGGGGGAGGLLRGTQSGTGRLIVSVGKGGAAGKNGFDSTLDFGGVELTAVGGGAGASDDYAGNAGGSGGGGGKGSGAGGDGVAGQGNKGGSSGGGGGGYAAAGTNGKGGAGGAGYEDPFTGLVLAKGGAGGTDGPTDTPETQYHDGLPGAPSTGNGGDGAYGLDMNFTGPKRVAGAGGSGVVIVRYQVSGGDDPEPPTPTVVTTNAMAEANWGYEIHGLGASGRDVALVFTNATADANMKWTAPSDVTEFDFLVVGGGGGGRSSGAGAGGVVTGKVAVVSSEPYAITVGAGGAAGGGTGGDSAFGVGEKDWVRAYGGAGGVGGNTAGKSGGCGSGAGTKGDTAGAATQGAFDALSVSSAVKFGCAGGTSTVLYGSAGGGGATEAGKAGSNTSGNKGGDGLESFITGESVWYAGGGTGGGNNHNGVENPGGKGGGGRGGVNADKAEASLIPYYRTGGNGVDGLGGGGGGVYTTNGGGAYGRGGSGVVIIRYALGGAPEPEPLAVEPGVPVVFGTAAEATNAMKTARLTPSEEVAKMFGGDADAKAAYCAMFEFGVVSTADGKWAVAAFLKPADWTNVVESAQSATRQLPLADIAALELGEVGEAVVEDCVPGLYYSLYQGSDVMKLKASIQNNVNVLCGPDMKVTFPEVAKPSVDKGFFTVGVLEAPFIIPGEDHIITGQVVGPVKPGRR